MELEHNKYNINKYKLNKSLKEILKGNNQKIVYARDLEKCQ